MDSETPRALALASAVFMGGKTPEELVEAFESDTHSPEKLSDDELAKLGGAINLDGAPDWVKADVPEWIWPAFENNFGEEAVAEGQALTKRPPLDLRINAIKSHPARELGKLEDKGAVPCDISPVGLRINALSGDGRLPNIQIEEGYQTGAVEIQDEGFDIDKRRLAPLYQRAQRAGADVIEVRQPPSEGLKDLVGKMDRVLIDAPCTGVGTWRRKPDAKWRLNEEALERRNNEQRSVLNSAKGFVKPGGLMFYVTCSMLAEENEAQVYAFLEDNDNFTLLSAGEVWEEKFGVDAPKPWSADGCTLTLTPESTNTDGFFFAVMERNA